MRRWKTRRTKAWQSRVKNIDNNKTTIWRLVRVKSMKLNLVEEAEALKELKFLMLLLLLLVSSFFLLFSKQEQEQKKKRKSKKIVKHLSKSSRRRSSHFSLSSLKLLKLKLHSWNTLISKMIANGWEWEWAREKNIHKYFLILMFTNKQKASFSSSSCFQLSW